MSKAGSKIIEGLTEALAYSKIDALWRRTKKKRSQEVTPYDWGYRDGLMAARELFGTTRMKKRKTASAKGQGRDG